MPTAFNYIGMQLWLERTLVLILCGQYFNTIPNDQFIPFINTTEPKTLWRNRQTSQPQPTDMTYVRYDMTYDTYD